MIPVLSMGAILAVSPASLLREADCAQVLINAAFPAVEVARCLGTVIDIARELRQTSKEMLFAGDIDRGIPLRSG